MENFISYYPSGIKPKKREFVIVKFSSPEDFYKSMEILDSLFIKYKPIYSLNSIELEKTPNYNAFLSLFDNNQIKYILEPK